ncbi:ferrochelatase [Panacibacter sp. DH6]|uniref:Ferrochelatase n=1 Tax=Panacibacter microcysteis TaxID=2793269 RepID=A0A931GYH0_9BACT|nr:ferrochelatase [Panacibacter microcysteis]MBG9375957.1 ferrochelatase [Panacibacter microcysteis]
MTKKGIVLVNLGSPDSTSVKDVRKYLNEFLMDERVIDMPYILRMLLVRGIIVPFRAPKSAEAYRSIWWKEGSPLIVLSKQLQAAVQQNFSAPVEIAMRYGNPSPKDAYDKLMRQVPGLEEVIMLPLYPHYAMSSYETAVVYMEEVHKKFNYPFRLTTIAPYYNNPDYIHALAESIKPYLQQDFDKLLFSYHGIPERHIYKGDITGSHCLKVNDCCHVASPAHQKCYRHQTFVTTELTTAALGLSHQRVEQSFQSRLGRDPWLTPYTAKRLEELPKEGVKKLLVACPAFVSDCLETLEEIAEEGKEIFLHAGGESFTMIPCLNIHPLWVQAVTKWIKEPVSTASVAL